MAVAKLQCTAELLGAVRSVFCTLLHGSGQWDPFFSMPSC